MTSDLDLEAMAATLEASGRYRVLRKLQPRLPTSSTDLSTLRRGLMLDVETADGLSFRGIADEDLTITELTQLATGQTLPVRYRPAVMDHCVALARDTDPAQVQRLADEIASRKRA